MRYLRYLLEKGASAVTRSFVLSREMVTASPSMPVLPLTLMRSWRNFSKEACNKLTVRHHSLLHKTSKTYGVKHLVIDRRGAVNGELENLLLLAWAGGFLTARERVN